MQLPAHRRDNATELRAFSVATCTRVKCQEDSLRPAASSRRLPSPPPPLVAAAAAGNTPDVFAVLPSVPPLAARRRAAAATLADAAVSLPGRRSGGP